MALTFKQFTLDEDHIVTLGPLAGPFDPAMGMTMEGNDWHDELNDQFADVFELPILSPDVGYRRVQEILSTANLNFPVLAYPHDPSDGEHIYAIPTTPPWFLYTAYVQDEQGQYEFYAEIMDEDTLNDFLASDLDEEDEDNPVAT